MAVRHSTRIGYGFYITNAEFLRLGSQTQFKNSPYTLAINALDPENTDYFFGITMASVTTGQGFCLPSRWNLSDEEVEEMINAFTQFFPNKVDKGCHDYVMADYEEVDE